MPIQFPCPKCAALLRVADPTARAVRCPKCGATIAFPAAEPIMDALPADAAPRGRPKSRPRHPWAIGLAVVVTSVAIGLSALAVFVPVAIFTAPKDAATIHAEYVTNLHAYEQEYDGKRLTVCGRVVGTTSSLGETAVELGTSKPGLFLVRFVSPADASRPAACRSLTASGTVTKGGSATLFLESSDLVSGD